jgi:magnesium chelatase subunit D
MTEARSLRWLDALRAASLLAIDPIGLRGIVVRGGRTPVRDQWLQMGRSLLGTESFEARVPLNVDSPALVGGLDLLQTMRTGQTCWAPGLFERAENGLLIFPMVEQLAPDIAALVGRTIEERQSRTIRDGVTHVVPTKFVAIALDESSREEPIQRNALIEQLAMVIDLSGVSLSDAKSAVPDQALIQDARNRLAAVQTHDEDIRAVCDSALQFGVRGMTGVVRAVRVACASAALSGYQRISEADLQLAARLVLADRATRVPDESAPESSTTQSQESLADAAGDPKPQNESEVRCDPPPEHGARADLSQPTRDEQTDQQNSTNDATNDASAARSEMMIEAIQAVLPASLLSSLESITPGAGRTTRQPAQGRFGQRAISLRRGRPIGVQRGRPGAGVQLSLLHTLRAAIPHQRARREQTVKGTVKRSMPSAMKIDIRPGDFRIRRYQHSVGTQTIFVVDASGSAAVHRLAEAKGAVELLLADCYIRRDTVALIAFRGEGAQLLLPPTRSLTRAKRELARLPGGGGTPMAAGLRLGATLADQANRDGQSPVVVILTDGRANVALDGTHSRALAVEQSLQVAQMMATMPLQAMVVDTSARRADAAPALALAMGGQCMALPYADAAALSSMVREYQQAA